MVRLMQAFQSLITSGVTKATNGCPPEGTYDVVVGHLTDTPYFYNLHPHGMFGLPGITDYIANFIFKLNSFLGLQVPHTEVTKICYHGAPTEVILADPVLFFGIFDLRITKWVLMMWAAAFLAIIIFIPLSRKIKKNVMGSKSRWVNLWEALIGFIHDEIVEPNFDGKYIKKAMPYFSSLFFFILFCNLIGLIPGAATATGNLAVTMGLALCTFFGMIIVGTVKQGPQWIITGIVPGGIPAFLFPMLWVIELVGMCIKPFALMIRLFANMTAGHVVIIIFFYIIIMFQNSWIGIASVSGSLIINLLELLVAFIQAYIFASLSAMFIGSSMHHH